MAMAAWRWSAARTACPAAPLMVARYKAETATRIGCTHFVESEPQQAILIAALAPHLIVTWWSPERGRPFTVGAAPGAGALPQPGLLHFR